MNICPIRIFGTDYDVVDTIILNNKNYVAYTDYECIYINEYIMVNDRMSLLKIDAKVFEEVKKAMNL